MRRIEMPLKVHRFEKLFFNTSTGPIIRSPVSPLIIFSDGCVNYSINSLFLDYTFKDYLRKWLLCEKFKFTFFLNCLYLLYPLYVRACSSCRKQSFRSYSYVYHPYKWEYLFCFMCIADLHIVFRCKIYKVQILYYLYYYHTDRRASFIVNYFVRLSAWLKKTLNSFPILYIPDKNCLHQFSFFPQYVSANLDIQGDMERPMDYDFEPNFNYC